MFDGVRHGAVVVAHPDDEVLWAGGLLARHGERYTVICCSIPRADPVRAFKFFAACETFGAHARLLPFPETDPKEPLQHLGLLDLSAFELVVTHNAQGEYGHPHHRALHRFVTERFPRAAATFGFRPDGSRGSEVLHLSADEQARKMAALRCYDHVSPHDSGKPKWQALMDRYALDFRTESFDPPAA